MSVFVFSFRMVLMLFQVFNLEYSICDQHMYNSIALVVILKILPTVDMGLMLLEGLQNSMQQVLYV